jgi:hypothetical protein
MAKKFWEWENSQHIRWKYVDHRPIVQQFDAGAEVACFKKYPDSYEVYDEQTLVTFSDGSKTNFNYKGEEGW